MSASIALESILLSLILGTGLVIAVAVALRLFPLVNAATRSVIWSATLLALPLISLVYCASHLPMANQSAAVPVDVKSILPRAAAAPISPVVPAQMAAATSPQEPVDHHLQIRLPEHLPEALLGCYAGVVIILLIRLLISYLRLCLLRSRTRPAAPELNARLDHWLTRCPTDRPVALRLSDTARSPLAIGFLKPIIVMPAALVLDLTEQEYDDLGVHELAHIRRFDDWTNLLQRVLQAFLFFHPAAQYLGRKLNLDREIACDDWVISGHEGKSYARCLAKVIELRRYQRGALLLSSGAFFGKRQIIKRVESLLNKTRNAATGTSSVVVICSVLALIGIASQMVNLPAVVAFTQEEAGATTSSRWSDAARDLRIKLRGDVTFTDDEQSVASISPGGFFIVDETKGWSHRRVEVRSGPGGAPEIRYFLDGREKPLDGVGQAWAAGTYLFALRETGIDSDGRVRRILTRKGPAGVLEEVSLIQSDRIKCDYLNHLLEQATLKSHELERIADSIRKVSSDNDKADFLIAHERDLTTEQVRTAYFAAVNSINSDNDRRRVLTHLLESDEHNPETARLVGLSAKSMNSDNDKAEVLLAASSDNHCGLLSAAQTINSDNDKARVLRDSKYMESASCRDAWFAVANLIHSDNDRSDVLQKLLTKTDLQPETYREVANSAKGMSSDNDKANVLVPLSSHYGETSLFDAVNSMNSDSDRGRVLKAVVEHQPAREELLSVIDSASKLNDDNEKTEILLVVAKQSKDTEVRAGLQKACEKLNSDNDYRRLASAIFNNATGVN